MKKTILLAAFILISTISYSQVLRTKKYEMYLTYLEENQVNVSKGMYMTKNTQVYYEGTIEVNFMSDDENTVVYNYFLSIWDDNYKEFRVTNRKGEKIYPTLQFEDNAVKIDDGEMIKLEDMTSLESTILSSMLVWLEHQKK